MGEPGLRAPAGYDLVCLSHLRWDFVWQRPQHLLSRCARERRVFFVEEPVVDGEAPSLELSEREDGPTIVIPHHADIVDALRSCGIAVWCTVTSAAEAQAAERVGQPAARQKK